MSERTEMGGMAHADLLTNAEHELLGLLGSCWNRYAAILRTAGGDVQGDAAEFASHIHDLQNAVMAQAAARAYPDRYRLAGSTFAAALAEGGDDE